MVSRETHPPPPPLCPSHPAQEHLLDGGARGRPLPTPAGRRCRSAGGARVAALVPSVAGKGRGPWARCRIWPPARRRQARAELTGQVTEPTGRRWRGRGSTVVRAQRTNDERVVVLRRQRVLHRCRRLPPGGYEVTVELSRIQTLRLSARSRSPPVNASASMSRSPSAASRKRSTSPASRRRCAPNPAASDRSSPTPRSSAFRSTAAVSSR